MEFLRLKHALHMAKVLPSSTTTTLSLLSPIICPQFPVTAIYAEMSVVGHESPGPSPGQKRPWMVAADATQDFPTPTKRTNFHPDNLAHHDYAVTHEESYEHLHPPSDGRGFFTPGFSITDYDLMDYGSTFGSHDVERNFLLNEEPANGAIEEVCFGMVRPREASHDACC
jgi:hypothetical protein